MLRLLGLKHTLILPHVYRRRRRRHRQEQHIFLHKFQATTMRHHTPLTSHTDGWMEGGGKSPLPPSKNIKFARLLSSSTPAHVFRRVYEKAFLFYV